MHRVCPAGTSTRRRLSLPRTLTVFVLVGTLGGAAAAQARENAGSTDRAASDVSPTIEYCDFSLRGGGMLAPDNLDHRAPVHRGTGEGPRGWKCGERGALRPWALARAHLGANRDWWVPSSWRVHGHRSRP
jgi:hypothetical protein